MTWYPRNGLEGRRVREDVLMVPIILSWNLNGPGDIRKIRWAGRPRRRWKAKMVLIQETKMECLDNMFLRKLWVGNGYGKLLSSPQHHYDSPLLPSSLLQFC